ncbi:hypothetical protein KEM54_006704 [Ascosphaera aggregata]|nr:hypothetical protein KEM54_006704 [Ascosphaera aggregata]
MAIRDQKLATFSGMLRWLASAVFTTSLIAAPPLTAALPVERHTSNGTEFNDQTFDYVVVGGGLAGLVVASRLSENPAYSVAVIEAGKTGYGNDALMTPASNLYQSSLFTERDWQYYTVPQEGLNNRQIVWNRGKVLGGSSAINGMYLVRQNAVEQDAWAALLRSLGPEAQGMWSWPNVLRGMIKSETFFPPTPELENVLRNADPTQPGNFAPYNEVSHGDIGPINHGFPSIIYENVGAFLVSASKVMNRPINPDPYSGSNSGPFLSASAINPRDYTRSFSRNAYIDSFLNRPNLFILTEHQATKILFDGETKPMVATGIEYSQSPWAPTYAVHARKEVIISGGAVGSPQLLQLSGIADKSILDPVGIRQVADVPGVGFHLQDHVLAELSWAPAPNTSIPHAGVTGNPLLDSYVNSGVGFVPIDDLEGINRQEIIQEINNDADAIDAEPIPETVKAGIKETRRALANTIYGQNMPAVEVLFENWYGKSSVQCALQHASSRGSLRIVSPNAFDHPLIDPGYLKQPTDLKLMRHGCRLARKIAETEPLSKHLAEELNPGPTVQTEEQWNTWVKQNSGSEYHPNSGCSMLPLELGGVVDHNFLVYHTKNLRVIDSSIVPISMSEHLMTVTYGLAELGAEVIQAAAY